MSWPRIGAARPKARLHQSVEALLRSVPIRWRILSIAALNTLLVIVVMGVIWESAQGLARAWSELRQARQSDRLVVQLENEAGRLQNLIHRYINQPSPEVLTEITRRRWTLAGTLATSATLDPALAGEVNGLLAANERLIAGFDELRELQTAIADTYEQQVLSPARTMSGLYAIVDGATAKSDALIWPALGKSREAFSALLVAANAFYLSLATSAADEARSNLGAIERTIPVMLDLADNELQRGALSALADQAARLRAGLDNLADQFATRSRLLREAIDGNQAARTAALDHLAGAIRTREMLAQERFDTALEGLFGRIAVVALVFLVISIVGGLLIAATISRPLAELRHAMHAIVVGDYAMVRGLGARDEIGDMARAVEVFRENAIAKRRAEEELRASKERAEAALSKLQDAQASLIEAEKLAALGGLVAGVAHEVNNPVGISLTVASSLARRCEVFAAEIESGPLRRSRLVEFVDGNRDAAGQLVANLQRAGELIQSFKQVAVDRSHADRRIFDLREATEQIIASLRPGLKKSRLELGVAIADGITMDSYPGPFGQVLTNLFLNSVTHGFAEGQAGRIDIEARKLNEREIEIVFRDDGIGMSEEVQRRAFDPFFTTRRSQGGTGLGLHIVYNLVTARLGGRIALASRPGGGARFTMTLPVVAPWEAADHAEPSTGR